MSKSFNENSRVKIPAIVHLTRLNYKYVSFKNVENYIDVETNIYKKTFEFALRKINAVELSDSDIENFIREIKNILVAEDLGRKFYDKLKFGIGDNIRLLTLRIPKIISLK